MRTLARRNTNNGFTVIELAVVIVVIAILALIVVFSLGAWRKNVATNEVKSDLQAVKAAMENARNFEDGYPSALPSSFTASPNVQATYHSGNIYDYCVDAESTEVPTVDYFVEAGGEPIAGTCATGPE